MVLLSDSPEGAYFQDIQDKSGLKVFMAQEGDQVRAPGDDLGLLAMIGEES
jgi:hypothetical protein